MSLLEFIQVIPSSIWWQYGAIFVERGEGVEEKIKELGITYYNDSDGLFTINDTEFKN